MSEKRQIFKAAGIVGSATLLSRILGMLRDMVVAAVFGAGPVSDAFFVAFRIPNLMRRLFAEGSLTVSFIPVFTDHLVNDGKEEAFRMGRSGFFMLGLILLVITILGISGAYWVVKIIAPGFDGASGNFDLTVSLTRYMFPYVLFICLTALCTGILNSLNHFAAPAFGPVYLNICLIAAALFLTKILDQPVYALSIGVIVGGIVQLAALIPPLIKLGFSFFGQVNLFHPGVKKVGKMMIPSIFGSAAYQIDMLVNTMLASMLTAGSVSYLYYADRLVQFPLALFGVSAATVILPTLSRQAAKNDMKGVATSLSEGFRLVSFVNLPAMAGLIALSYPIVSVILQRGAFNPLQAKATSEALVCYSVGLWAFSSVRIVLPVYYAVKDIRTPAIFTGITVTCDILFAMWLMTFLGHKGLALSTSLSSMVNVCLLTNGIRPFLKDFDWKGTGISLIKTVFCSTVMGVIIYFTGSYMDRISSSFIIKVLYLAVNVLFGVAIYTGLSYVLGSRELKTVYSIIKRKK